MKIRSNICVISCLCILINASLLLAEKGYVWEGDLNGDGRIDTIQSGPMSHFGNRGGPYVLRVSKGKDGWVEHVIGFGHMGNIAVEKLGTPDFRLWGYHGHSAGEGGIFVLTIGDQLTSEGITIFAGDQGTDLGRDLYNAVFKKERMLTFKIVDNYEVPRNPNNESGEW